jgi:fimbrial isopeptide formation D2 family protein/LPXTG-motif cell wall-anchored protein
MKNKTRVILAALLALTIIFSMSVLSLAADPPAITINRPNESVSMMNHTYQAFKIFDIAEDTNGSLIYTLNSAYTAFFNNLDLSAYSGDINAKAYEYVAARDGHPEDFQTLAKALYNHAQTNSISPDSFVKATAADTATITGLTPGYYLVYDAGSDAANPDSAEKAIANIALTNANPTVTIDLKATVPTIDKKITGVNDAASNAVATDGEDGASAQIGQHIAFQIDSIVPDLVGYSTYTYKVTDTMDAGLTPDQNVAIKIGNAVLAAAKYTVEYNGQVTTITIPKDTLAEYVAGTPIAITYSATVNSDANVYPYANPLTNNTGNTAELEYSSNVEDTTEKTTTPPTNVHVYLFELDITKTNSKGETLAGAEFTLKDPSNNDVYVVQDATTKKYKVVSSSAAIDGITTTVVSDENGKIYIDGLAAGTYNLVETKAPTDYNLLTDPVEIVISATYNADGTLNAVSGNTVTVVNRSGAELPGTGGIGTYIFTIGGAIIMVTAVAYLILKKKNEAAE